MLYFWKVFIVLFVVVVIFSLSSMIPMMMQSSGIIKTNSFFTPALTHLLMIFFAFVGILLHGIKRFSEFGLQSCSAEQYISPILWALIVGTLTQMILYLLFPSFVGKQIGPAAHYSFAQIVLFVWILASIAEELVFRGLIQSILSPLSRFGLSVGNLTLSVPVIIAAVLFGLIHLGLLTMDVDAKYVLTIVTGAVIAGLMAGYFREKTGSIWPAVAVHSIFNITGSAVEFVLSHLLK